MGKTMPVIEGLHVDPKKMPYDTGVYFDWHRHQCPRCGLTWAHDGGEERSREEYAAAHHCPRCGTEQIWCAPPTKKEGPK